MYCSYIQTRQGMREAWEGRVGWGSVFLSLKLIRSSSERAKTETPFVEIKLKMTEWKRHDINMRSQLVTEGWRRRLKRGFVGGGFS